jgi:beta,beta-carotene 9',10'-dioxygenase
VSVNKFGDDVVALTETTLPIRFDPSTLQTLGVYDYGRNARGQLSIAHPHLDCDRRCSYTYVLNFGRKSEYRVLRIGWETKRKDVISRIATDKPA